MRARTFINPVLKKDILVNARNAKMIVAITLINCLFALIAAGTFAMSSGMGYQAYYSYIVKLFPILAACELGIICMVLPIMTSTSVSGERERQTLDIMLTTPVKPSAIVFGKLASAMATTFMYVIATLPFLAVSFVVGGLGWSALGEYIGIVLYVDIYIGSFGMLFSCVKRTSVSAAVTTIITVASIILLTYIVGKVMDSAMFRTGDIDQYKGYLAGIMTCYAMNPFVWIVDFAQRTFYADSVLPSLDQAGRYSTFVAEHMQIISITLNMIVAFVLLKIAAVRITSGGRKKKTIQKGV